MGLCSVFSGSSFGKRVDAEGTCNNLRVVRDNVESKQWSKKEAIDILEKKVIQKDRELLESACGKEKITAEDTYQAVMESHRDCVRFFEQHCRTGSTTKAMELFSEG